MSTPAASLAMPLQQPVILGLQLRPLTLGHLILLDEIGCEFLRTAKLSAEELPVIAFVCCQAAPAARQAVGRWWAPLFFRAWGWLYRKRDLAAECSKLRDWYDAECRQPGFTRLDVKPGEYIHTVAPWHWRLLTVATTELGLSIDEATTLPLRQLNAIYVTRGELTGRVKLWTDDDVKFYRGASATAVTN